MLPSSPKPLINTALQHQHKWRGRIGLTLVASLSVLAGMTDAIGFMASGDFVSFMSGNTTRLAVAISEGDLGLTGRLTLLVATFILGNALGVIISRISKRHAAVRRGGVADGRAITRGAGRDHRHGHA